MLQVRCCCLLCVRPVSSSPQVGRQQQLGHHPTTDPPFESIRRLLAGPGKSYDGLLRYFLRTKQLVEQRGPLPTSRQQARCRSQRQQGQEQQAGPRAASNVSSRSSRVYAAAVGEQRGGDPM